MVGERKSEKRDLEKRERDRKKIITPPKENAKRRK